MNENTSPQTDARPIAKWRIIVAAILDFFTAFFVIGYAVALLTGGTTTGGFLLNGLPALILFALIAAYFWIGGKYLGGTLWQRILKAR